jgi:hypothetical protein
MRTDCYETSAVMGIRKQRILGFFDFSVDEACADL